MGNIKVKGKMQRVTIINDNCVVACYVMNGHVTIFSRLSQKFGELRNYP